MANTSSAPKSNLKSTHNRRKKFDWDLIRRLWMGGESPYRIAKRANMPSRQQIQVVVKQESWERPVKGEYVEGKDIQLGKNNAVNRKRVIQTLAEGAPYKVAAAVIGINPATLRNWRKDDAFFEAQCQEAIAKHAVSRVGDINRAAPTDWRAAAYMAERNELTRDTFRVDKGSSRVNVNVGFMFARDDGNPAPGAVIDHEE